MSRQIAADVPGVPVATGGVSAGDIASIGRAAGCAAGVATCPKSD